MGRPLDERACVLLPPTLPPVKVLYGHCDGSVSADSTVCCVFESWQAGGSLLLCWATRIR